MGFYYSEDGRYYTSTFGFPPTTSLTTKGVRDTDAAVTIQRWWRGLKHSSDIISASSSDYTNLIRRRTYKRKHEDIDSDIIETETETDLDIEETNSSEFEEVEVEVEGELQTIENNNFIWDLWFSFYNFLWKLFGY